MADKEPKKQPTIRFGGLDIPTHEAWEKLEIAETALTRFKALIDKYPDLANAELKEAERVARQRLASVQVSMPSRPAKTPDLEELVRRLAGEYQQLDDILDALCREHGVELDYLGLVHIMGLEAYQVSLGKELKVYEANALSDEQVAEIWNELQMPTPGGAVHWDSAAIERLRKELV